MANQITATKIDSYQFEGSTSFLPNNNINGFPFTPEQCQQLLSLLNSTASTCGTKKVLSHMANSTLLSISYDYFQDGTCLDLKHFVFNVNPVNRNAYGSETQMFNTGATYHIIHSITLFTKITSSISTFVQLPNGVKATVTHIGTIQVTSSPNS